MTDDPTGVYLTEFFNRSVKKVWSTDGTAPGPGAILTPDLASADGTLTPSPETDYALTLNGVELQAPVVTRMGPYILYDVGREPLQLASGVNGIDRDGWIADTDGNGIAEASYNRFDDVARRARLRNGQSLASRLVLGRRTRARRRFESVRSGSGPTTSPRSREVTQEQTKTVTQCTATGFRLAAPNGPWRIEVEITPTFSPHDLDPNHSDRRQLGAVFTARLPAALRRASAKPRRGR